MGLIKRYYDNFLYYKIEGFQIDNKMRHLFSSRINWEQDKIFDNLSEILGLANEDIYRVRQVHGTDVLIINEENLEDINSYEYDGLLTSRKNIALCTYHADCVPIFFYDPKKEVIGVAHAGWKGTLNNIAKNMVKNMIEDFNSNKEDIRVAIGPSIGQCCYEIGSDVEGLFKERYIGENVITYNENKIYLDLWKANYINLLNEGISENNIFSSNFCTSCNVDTLFSYRKEKGTKYRMIASIILKD